MDSRGPDARTTEVFAGGVLGACVDSSGPPAWDLSRRWLVFVTQAPTNLRALRTELAARDRVGPEASPSALAAAIFTEIGFERGLGRLEGDSAIVAWDAQDQVLYVARDRAGLFPVHFTRLPAGGLAFATDLSALAALPGFHRAVDPAAVATLAVLGLLPPPESLLDGVEHLGAGTLMKAGSGGHVLLRWWETGANPAGGDGAAVQWAKSLRMSIELATRQRGGDQVAVACGGGAYSRALARMVDPSGTGMDVIRFGPRGTVDLSPGDLEGVLDEMAAGLGEPTVAPEGIGWWVVAREAWRRGHTCVLTGLGGTAAFEVPVAGTRRRLAGTLGISKPLQPHWARPLLAPDATDPVWAAIDLLEAACPTTVADAAGPWLARRLLLAERMLAPAERACAAFGVRLAAPLADPRLLTLAASIPLEHHRAGGVPRALFLRAVADLVPAAPAPSAPLPIPLDVWFRGPCRGLLDGLPDRVASIVAPAHTRALIDGHAAGRFDASRRLWALLLIERWSRSHDCVVATHPSWADSGPPIL